MNQSDPRSAVADALHNSPITFLVVQDATLTLPAYTSGNEPRYAKPVGATGNATPNLYRTWIYSVPVKPHYPLRRERVLLPIQRAQTAARIAKLDTENASLNVRLQAIRKEVFQKIKSITPPNPPVAMASGEVGLHAKLHGRIEAQRHTEIKSIQEKIQFMNDVNSYTQRWVALYNELGDGEKDILNQASRDRALRSQLQAQIAVLDARILQQNHGALNH